VQSSSLNWVFSQLFRSPDVPRLRCSPGDRQLRRLRRNWESVIANAGWMRGNAVASLERLNARREYQPALRWEAFAGEAFGTDTPSPMGRRLLSFSSSKASAACSLGTHSPMFLPRAWPVRTWPATRGQVCAPTRTARGQRLLAEIVTCRREPQRSTSVASNRLQLDSLQRRPHQLIEGRLASTTADRRSALLLAPSESGT